MFVSPAVRLGVVFTFSIWLAVSTDAFGRNLHAHTGLNRGDYFDSL